MDWKNLLPIISKFISWITGKKLIMLFLAIVVTVVLLTMYQRREDIGAFIGLSLNSNAPDTTLPNIGILLTPEITQHIKDTVANVDTLNYVGVISANIRINQRELVQFYSNDAVITSDIKASGWHAGSSQSIFTSSEKNNAQMVSVINGEFGCYKYQDAINFASAPQLASKIPYVCRMSIPPYYGEFSGYVEFGLASQPDENKVSEVRLEAVRIATEIYFKVVSKNKKPQL